LRRTKTAAAIAAIYNEGIAERIATFETEPRTAEQIVRQLLDKGDRFPTIVAERWSGRRVGRRRPLSNSPGVRRAGFLEDRVPDLS
jgi:phosphinothricin acetyltransferase